ncbi:MAG TPA: ABC transporter substrate-binding protein [Candidatus Binatia bacterium]|jgi:ABC-type nitrate/sulfonate/bicarbonate transport system substrate-binding protein
MIAICLAAFLAFASAVFTPAAAEERPRIFLGASSKTLGYSPLWVASKKGFFEQQGLDGQVVLLRGVPMTVQALISGSLHFGSGGPEPYIEASERGLDMVVTGGIINGLTQYVIGAKNFRTYEDLRGASIGQSSLTGGIVTAFREALRLKGLEYPHDYKIIVIAGGSSANLAAMQSGQIAATTVAVPLNFPAEEAGFNVIGKLIDVIPYFQVNALVTKRSWAEKNRPLMVRFMKAMVLALRWLYQNRDAAVEFLSKEMQLKPAHALKGWEYYTQNRIWPIDGDVTLEGMKYNVRFYAEQTGAKGPPPDPGKFVDRSYLLEALRELDKK